MSQLGSSRKKALCGPIYMAPYSNTFISSRPRDQTIQKGHGSDVVSSAVRYGPRGWCPLWWRPIKNEKRPKRLPPLYWSCKSIGVGWVEEATENKHLEDQEVKARRYFPQAALRPAGSIACPHFKPREILKGSRQTFHIVRFTASLIWPWITLDYTRTRCEKDKNKDRWLDR